MSNLIISILAIGAAAAMAIAGIWYGGSAFMASYYKGQATQIVNYFDTYAKAINVWAQRNGGTLPEPAKNYPITDSGNAAWFQKTDLDSFLVPRFIQTSTIPSQLLPSTVNTRFYYWNENGTYMQSPVIMGVLGPSGTQLCQQIEMMRTGIWPSSFRTFNLTVSQINSDFCGNYGCLGTGGIFGSTSVYTYLIYYRVHGRVNINYPDVSPLTCS
jgi:hypothetical protein